MRWRLITKTEDPQHVIRIPKEMRDLIKTLANKNGRSFNSEILYRLAYAINGFNHAEDK